MDLNLEIFTPVQQIFDPLFESKGLNVFIKRDDLIHPLISGNKWRKLKYILADARQTGKNNLVTFGGAYSNHLLAMAAAAAKFGFRATAFVRGEEVENDTLFLCRLLGTELIFVDREAYRDKQALFKQHFKDDPTAYFIDEGGSSALAAKGCSELVEELPLTYDHIFCACGTGTTVAGLLNGLRNKDTLMHAVPALKNGDFLVNDIKRYITYQPVYELHANYHFGGYAKTTPELVAFIKSFIARTGILIEPVYTGKMLYALYDLATKDHFLPGSNILAIHTGGLIGILGMKAKF